MCCRQSRYCGGSRVSASVRMCAIKSLRTSGGGTPNSYSRPLIVQAHLFQLRSVCNAIPAEIVAPVPGAQFVVNTRNRVAEGLKLIGQEEGIIGKHRPAGLRREIGFIRRAT